MAPRLLLTTGSTIDNIKALATAFRWATAGSEYAEALMVLKEIW